MNLYEKGRELRLAGDPSVAARFLTEAAEQSPNDRAVPTELALARV